MSLLDELQKGTENQNVNVTENNSVSIPLVTTMFQSTTTLEDGEHKVILKSVEKGATKNSSEKLTITFKDQKSSLVAIDTLSFGTLETHRQQWERLKYLVQGRESEELAFTHADNIGLEEKFVVNEKTNLPSTTPLVQVKLTIGEIIPIVDKVFNKILQKNNEDKTVIEIKTDTKKEDFTLDAEVIASVEDPSDLQLMEEEMQQAYVTALKEEKNRKYTELKEKGFQIFRPMDSKVTYALIVDKNVLAEMIPYINKMFNALIGKPYIIKVKTKDRYKNITSIHSV
jgi:hypothetical protein